MAKIATILFSAAALIAGVVAGSFYCRSLPRTGALMEILIELAVQHLPDEMKDRFSEEWKSHVNDAPSDLAKSLAAFRFLMASARFQLAALRLKSLQELGLSVSTYILQLSSYLANEENLRKVKRSHAIFTGFVVQLIMIFLVAICAMSRQGLYIILSIAACLWIQVAVVWAVHYSTKVWPTALIHVTTVTYTATGMTLALVGQSAFAYQEWLLCFLWLCVGFITVMSLIEISKHDFKDDGQRAT
jgi:hypothetical protein